MNRDELNKKINHTKEVLAEIEKEWKKRNKFWQKRYDEEYECLCNLMFELKKLDDK